MDLTDALLDFVTQLVCFTVQAVVCLVEAPLIATPFALIVFGLAYAVCRVFGLV